MPQMQAKKFSRPEDAYTDPGWEPTSASLDLTWTTDGAPYHYVLTTRYEIPCQLAGSVTIGASVELAYVDQSRESLAADATVYEEITGGVDRLVVGGRELHGRAYVAGFSWALERGYDMIVEMDADGSHRPEDLPRLLAALDGADAVIGSRYVPGGTVVRLCEVL